MDWPSKSDEPEERPKHPFQFSTMKHRELKVVSLIQESLWSQAGWRGLGFQTCEGEIPVLIFGFENAAVGHKIFENIAKTIGDKDPNNALRIALIRGIDRQNPAHYRVAVTSNLDRSDVGSSKIQAALSRLHTMTPSSSENIDRFLKDYEVHKKCHVATVDAKGRLVSHLITSGVVVMHAWEIDENVQEISAIQPDDDIHIPAGLENPPIIRALAKIRSLESR